MAYVISTDAGGTFIDAVIFDDRGNMAFGKSSTIREDLTSSLIKSVDVAAAKMGISLESIFKGCRLFLNGTTVTTNAMIELKGAKCGLLITKGFEDTLVIGRVISRVAGLSEMELMNQQRADRPAPIVPITLTRGVRERIDYLGRVVCPLDMDNVMQQVDELVEQGIQALAVCLLWSFKNPCHEKAIKDMVLARHPGIYITISSDIVPLIKEYERANTTAMNSFLGPAMKQYASGMRENLEKTGYKGDVLLMQSTGGLTPIDEACNVPVATLFSGPVGGVIASQKIGSLIGEKNIITTDMGGTSFDVSLIMGGETEFIAAPVIHRYISLFPTVAVVTIGAGGGSTAWLDEGSALRVGPNSQGAVPGPACYGRGGMLPTVTDADVILGYINPDYFLGGTIKLSTELAQKALDDKICRRLGMTLQEAAEGIYRIVGAHMADLIRKVSVERGFDPTNFCLFAYGGCGPTHCTFFAPEMGIKKVIVPFAETAFSALGIALADIKHVYSRSFSMTVPRDFAVDQNRLDNANTVFEQMISQAAEQLKKDGVSEEHMIFIRSIDLRYRSQVHELMIPLKTAGPLNHASLHSLCSDFVNTYEKRYGPGSSSGVTPMELVTLRVDGVAPSLSNYKPVRYKMDNGDISKSYWGKRRIFLWSEKKYEDVKVYRGERLAPGNRLEGPAILELYGTTVPLFPQQQLSVDEYLNLIITFETNQ